MGSEKILEVTREEEMEKTKTQNKVSFELKLSGMNNTHKHNSCIIPLLIKSQLLLQVIVWTELVLSF